MRLGKEIILLFCVFSLLPKVASVEKFKRERVDDRNEKIGNATEVAEKGNLELAEKGNPGVAEKGSLGSTFFPTEMKSNRNAKLNPRNCRLKVTWF